MTTTKNYKLSMPSLVLGGLMLIISVFLPAVTVYGESFSFINHPTIGSGVGIFFIVLGVIIAVVGLVKKRWLHILSIILGALITLLTINYFADARGGASAGLYLMLIGGILSVIGSLFGFMKK